MPRKCKVCAHPKTREMEEAYVSGKPKTAIARKYSGISARNVDEHMDRHLPQKLVRSVQRKEQAHAESILDGIEELLNDIIDIKDEAKDKGQKRLALDAIKEGRGTYELLSKIAVKLEEYRRADEEKEQSGLQRQVQEGLQALSDQELKALIQLTAKVHAADPNHELDPNTRTFLDGTERIWPETKDKDTKDKASQSNFPRNSPSQVENRREDGSNDNDDEFDWDDLDDLNLDDLEDDSVIPSEETDPPHIVRERQRKRRRNR